MNNVDLYIAAIPDSPIGTLIPDERQEQIEHTRNEKVRRQRYFVWKLLEYALERSMGLKLENMSLEKNEHGKWSAKECFFSLSHCDGALAAAVSKKPVGVDIECAQRAVPDRLLDRIFTPGELERYSLLKDEEKNDFLLRAWSAKESIFKAGSETVFSPGKIETDKNVKTGRAELGGNTYIFAVASEDISEIKVYENVELL